MAAQWVSIFLIWATMLYLAEGAPSRVWINYDPTKRFEHTAIPILSQEHVLHSSVKNSPAILGNSFLLTEETNKLSKPTPLPARTVAPATATVKITHPTPLPKKSFKKVVPETYSTSTPVASRTPQVATENSNRVNSTKSLVFQRPSSTPLPASRTVSSVTSLTKNTKQILQKTLPTVAKTQNSRFTTTVLPTSPARAKTIPTTESPVPLRTRATPKPSTKTTLGKGNQGTVSPNKSDNSSLIAPSSIIVVPPLMALCPDGQKADDFGICREEFR